MKRHRIILIISSLVLIVVLYFLPRVVIDNDQGQAIENSSSDPNENEADEADREIQNLHSTEISDQDNTKIDKFKTEIDSEGSDRLALADSLSRIYSSYNQFDSAAKYYEIIAEIRPDPVEFEKTGNAYYDALGFAMDKELANAYSDKARYYFEKLLKEDPSRLDIKNKLAMTYISSTNPMQGITLLREILETDPENENGLFNMGILAIQSGQYERASERFKNLVSLYPQNLQAQFYLGLCYFELGEKDNARRQFELVKSMESDPAVLATIDGYLKELN
jgi:tetratricopeptide (TPR) repeat protein